MTTRLADTLLRILQWALAVVLFNAGLLQAGLPLEALELRFHLAPGTTGQALAIGGVLQAVAALLVLVPTLTGFLPGLAPLTAAGLALAFIAAGAGHDLPLGLGLTGFSAAMAAACAVVAVGRTLVAPVAPIFLGPETRDPWHRPPDQLEHLRRSQEAQHPTPVDDAGEARRPAAEPAGRWRSRVAARPVERPPGPGPRAHH